MKQTTTKWLNKPPIKRILALFFASFLICFTIMAQERVVTGVVTDANGQTMPGVNVVLKGTKNGTLTDINGKYSIKVEGEQAVLTFSFIGFSNQEVEVGAQSSINITLKEEIKEMDEVVVVGYGVQKKKLVTGSEVEVKNEDMVNNDPVRVESALQGLTPGMTVVKQSGQPGADYNITIRGIGSVNGSTPLVLIDGVPGSLNDLNPSDIATIDVLKDAASAAIYGSRAGDGVILVTTKKGKPGEMQVSYDCYFGISNPAHEVQLLNAQQYMQIINEAEFNSNPKETPYFSQAYMDSVGNKSTNWEDAARKKNALQVSQYVGITGGNDKSTYSISLSYTNQEGIYDFEGKSDYQRLGFRINSEHQVKKYLKIGENLTYTHVNSMALGNGNIYSNFFHDLINASPLIPEYDPSVPDGYGRVKLIPGANVPSSDQFNPIANENYNDNAINRSDNIVGNVYAELEVIPGLKLRTDFGGTMVFQNNSNYTDTFTLTPYDYNSTPDLIQSMSRNFNYNWDNYISWEKSFGENNISLMAGMNAEDSWYFNMYGERKGFLINPSPVLNNVVTGLKLDTAEGDFGKGDSRYSYFGRIGYNYSEKWLATINFRRDYSSRFGPENRAGNFPSISGGYVISKESFMETLNPWLDFLKLRVSWGENGKEPPNPYLFLATVGDNNMNYAIGNTKQVGVAPNIMANPNLQWETAKQFDIGFDSKFLKNFIFSFDCYQKTSGNWIIPETVPAITGIAAMSTGSTIQYPYINGGNVINKGVEFDLSYVKKFGDLLIDIKANLALNKNKVTDVPDTIIHGSSSVLFNGSPEFYRVQSGYPMGYFWGLQTAGVFQDTAEINHYTYTNPKTGKVTKIQPNAKPGDLIYVDRNHDGTINEDDCTDLGDPNPHYVYGLNLGASYKGFDLSIIFQGQGGNKIVESYRDESRFDGNYTTDILNRWHGPGTSNSMPRVDETNLNWRGAYLSDIYVHDASFLRIKSVNLGYDFKKSLLKNIPVQQLRIYISADNLFTFTSYKGIDPEIGYGSYYNSSGVLTDGYASGIDMGNYPVARTFMLGVNVKF
jgi:TonB-linked SusC/RagA family outer membrane protein